MLRLASCFREQWEYVVAPHGEKFITRNKVKGTNPENKVRPMIDKIGTVLKWMRTDHTVDCRIVKADEDYRVFIASWRNGIGYLEC